jgi:hypothetical protein
MKALRTSQPGQPAFLDLTNRYTRGILSAWTNNWIATPGRIDPAKLGTSVAGPFGQASSCNGTSDVITLPAGSLSHGGACTKFAFLKIGAATSTHCISGSGNSTVAWRTNVAAIDIVNVGVQVCGSFAGVVSANEVCTLAFVVGGTGVTGDPISLYKNGILFGSSTLTVSLPSGAGTPQLGSNGAAGQFWDGSIAFHADFSVALTASEILALHTNAWQVFYQKSRRQSIIVPASTGSTATIAGTSTLAGTLVGIGALSANIDCTSTLAGTLTGIAAAIATIGTTSSVSGTLTGIGALAMSIGGLSSVAATLTGIGQLNATIGASSSVNAVLGTGSQMATIAATSTVAATMSGSGAFTGQIDNTSSVSATLSAGGTAQSGVTRAFAIEYYTKLIEEKNKKEEKKVTEKKFKKRKPLYEIDDEEDDDYVPPSYVFTPRKRVDINITAMIADIMRIGHPVNQYGFRPQRSPQARMRNKRDEEALLMLF